MAQTLTRETGLLTNTTPTGRTIGIVKYLANPALLRLGFIDGKSGSLPDNLTGLYTNSKLAQADLTSFLNQFWDTSDKATAKNK